MLTQEELKFTPGIPILYISVQTSKGKQSNNYAFSIGILVYQIIRLERDPSIRTIAITWKNQGIAGCTSGRFKSYVREGLRDGLDVFLNDYLAENPK